LTRAFISLDDVKLAELSAYNGFE